MVTTKPTVHLNGTSPTSLSEGYEAAVEAIRAAERTLADASPNARDYYPQGPGAFDVADDEHRARRLALAAVREDLEALWEHVQATRGRR